MSQIANQPRSLEDRLKTMNDLYETNSYHPEMTDEEVLAYDPAPEED